MSNKYYNYIIFVFCLLVLVSFSFFIGYSVKADDSIYLTDEPIISTDEPISITDEPIIITDLPVDVSSISESDNYNINDCYFQLVSINETLANILTVLGVFIIIIVCLYCYKFFMIFF